MIMPKTNRNYYSDWTFIGDKKFTLAYSPAQPFLTVNHALVGKIPGNRVWHKFAAGFSIAGNAQTNRLFHTQGVYGHTH
jgi:hypothetical protein